MTIDIDSLPLPGEGITEPVLDQRDTDISFLSLEDDMVQNPLSSDLNTVIPDFETVNNLIQTGNLSQSTIDDAIFDVNSTIPNGVEFTILDKINMLADLDTLKACTAVYAGLTPGALVGAQGLLEHSDIVGQNIGITDGVTSQLLTYPKMLTTDIEGGLPTTFPGIPQLSGLPNFQGLSAVPAIPSLGLPALDAVPGLPNLGTLPGVNLPGVPDADDVLKAVSGTVLAEEFGGVGCLVTGNSLPIAASALTGMNPLGGNVSDILAAGTDPIAMGGLVAPLSTNVAAFVPGLDDLAGPFGDMGGGLGSLLAGEQAALFGGGCVTISPLTSAAACASGFGSLASAASVTNGLKTSTGAKLVSSSATSSLDTLLGGFT